MFALARLMFVGFIVLTVVYVSLSFYSRAVRRGKLKAEWYDGPQTTDIDSYVDQGLADYDGSLRRKLILGVYIVPFALMCVIIYLTNFA